MARYQWSPKEALEQASAALPDASFARQYDINPSLIHKITEVLNQGADDQDVFDTLLEARAALPKAWPGDVPQEVADSIDATIRVHDIELLQQYPAKTRVDALYRGEVDDDKQFADALNRLIPGFEYPDYSHMTVGEVDRKIALEAQKLSGKEESMNSKSEAPKTEYVVKSLNITRSVNEVGLAEIKEFLAANHKKGGDHFTRDMLQAWAADAEFQLGEGNPASIEITAPNSIHGRTQEYTISDAGLDTTQVEVEESIDVQEATNRAFTLAQKLWIGVDENAVADALTTRKGPDKGLFIGKIVGVDEELGLVYQSTGQGKGVVLPAEKLSRAVTAGVVESITFKDGVGTVADRSQSLGKGRE